MENRGTFTPSPPPIVLPLASTEVVDDLERLYSGSEIHYLNYTCKIGRRIRGLLILLRKEKIREKNLRHILLTELYLLILKLENVSQTRLKKL